MAVMVECPGCHRKQKLTNKKCGEGKGKEGEKAKGCGIDLDKEKRKRTVRYWVTWRDAGGKLQWEPMEKTATLNDAKAADGKRKAEKIEKPRILKRFEEEKMTFKELADWYLAYEHVKQKAYYSTLTYNLASFNEVLGGKVVSKITTTDLKEYQAKRKAEGYSDSYVDQHLGAAKTVINEAYDVGKVSIATKDTFRKVKKLLKRNTNRRDRILLTEEYDRLMQCLPRHTKAILATAFYTGMRQGEILALTWDKVDLKSRFIRLAAIDTKDGEPRKVPICDSLHEILTSLPRHLHDNHVFIYKGKPISDIRTGVQDACEKAGIIYGRFKKGGFVFHDLRHTFNTYMRKAGVPESVIMEITGHSTREMFDRYNSVDDDDGREALDRLEGYLQGVNYPVNNQEKRG